MNTLTKEKTWGKSFRQSKIECIDMGNWVSSSDCGFIIKKELYKLKKELLLDIMLGGAREALPDICKDSFKAFDTKIRLGVVTHKGETDKRFYKFDTGICLNVDYYRFILESTKATACYRVRDDKYSPISFFCLGELVAVLMPVKLVNKNINWEAI
jgi:hypothetical protein